jgi:hypothetical protein
MNIFKKIGKSVYGPEFYSDIKNQRTGSAVRYYLKLSLLLTIVLTVFYSIVAISAVTIFTSDSNISKIISNFPSDLTITIKDKQFSTNVSEPYKIPVPGIFVSTTSQNQIENLLVIDTSLKDIPTDILTKNKTIAFMTKNAIITERGGALQINTLDKFGNVNFVVNQESIHSFVDKYLPYVKTLLWFVPIPIFIVVFIVYVAKLISFFLLALVVWLVLRIKKMDRGYMHAYRVTIYAQTLPLIVFLVFGGFGAWFLSLLVTIIIVLINMEKTKNPEISEATPTQINP